MFSRCLSAALLLAASAAWCGELRVCAEPDNLPFSHRDESGFENRIAALLSRDLGMALIYAWEPQRRGFVRKTFGAGLCDVWMGVPGDFERMLTTRPYYRSRYVFVYDKRALRSFDDPDLRRLRIGVQLPGNDLAATPAGYALALRGAIDNVLGFPIYGQEPSAQRIVAAIARGELDAGVVWGPAAGFFAAKAALAMAPAVAPAELAAMPFEFSIAIGVRKGEPLLRDSLDAAIGRRQAAIDAILDAYAVPRIR
jgi:mxaJ protein